VTADAQTLPVRLPAGTLPPLGSVTDAAAGALGDVRGTLDGRPLEELRRLRIDELLRTNRERLERDPHGDAVVKHEVVAISPTQAALDRAVHEGYDVARRRWIDALGLEVVTFRAPEGMSTTHALKRLRKLDPTGAYDFNHVYTGSGERDVATAAHSQPLDATNGVAAPSNAIAPTPQDASVAVGLVDGGVDWHHPAFNGVSHQDWGCDGSSVASAHGTAVASLLVRHAESPARRKLYAADVFCGTNTDGAAATIAEALGWLAHEHVPVVNVSLVGPPNQLLERVIAGLVARGHLVVAAVGNDGPTAKPLYPAAYPGVVGVTGVDAHRRVLIEACRGPQVDFAARGADLRAAGANDAFVDVRGTSFAAPLVANLLASAVLAPDPAIAMQATQALAARAIDLGATGPDTTYGAGLVGADLVDEAVSQADSHQMSRAIERGVSIAH
jgi:hypothetical protein